VSRTKNCTETAPPSLYPLSESDETTRRSAVTAAPVTRCGACSADGRGPLPLSSCSCVCVCVAAACVVCVAGVRLRCGAISATTPLTRSSLLPRRWRGWVVLQCPPIPLSQNTFAGDEAKAERRGGRVEPMGDVAHDAVL
jgi:hypothetical protein